MVKKHLSIFLFLSLGSCLTGCPETPPQLPATPEPGTISDDPSINWGLCMAPTGSAPFRIACSPVEPPPDDPPIVNEVKRENPEQVAKLYGDISLLIAQYAQRYQVPNVQGASEPQFMTHESHASWGRISTYPELKEQILRKFGGVQAGLPNITAQAVFYAETAAILAGYANEYQLAEVDGAYGADSFSRDRHLETAQASSDATRLEQISQWYNQIQDALEAEFTQPAPADCQRSADNLVGNGGFELPETPTLIYTASLPCWTIEQGDVAEIDTLAQWPPAEGQHSLDLDPHSPGIISQVLETEIEQPYQLRFQLAGNIYGGNERIKTVEVFWGAHSLGRFDYDTTGINRDNYSWKPITVDIPPNQTLEAQTTLKFVSRNTDSAGPVLDAIQVTKAIE